MAIKLKNSLFIHTPKVGGRTVTKALLDHVSSAEVLGDLVMDAHARPMFSNLETFGFVRHPVTFLHSLWHHRARKKATEFGQVFNWQPYLRLERDCGDPDFLRFLEKTAARQNLVWDYYMFYLGGHRKLHIGKLESLLDDLVRFLKNFDEKFDEEAIFAMTDNPIGVSKKAQRFDLERVPRELHDAVIKAEPILCERFDYI